MSRRDARVALRRRICDLAMTQQQYARRIGASGGTISTIISGKGCPSLRVACAIEDDAKIPARAWLPNLTDQGRPICPEDYHA